MREIVSLAKIRSMFVVAVALTLPLAISGADLLQIRDPYAPLRLYQGAWALAARGASRPDIIVNRCARVGAYFGCEQTVNGKPAGLILFLPLDTAGAYHTQFLDADARARGRGDLTIAGNNWLYSTRHPGDSVGYHRTTNVFTGRDRIHFEAAESRDGVAWTVTASGDERRLDYGRM
ncbi:MAG: hypothetical protein M3R65_01980 [Gemmatimonadota bacterium]|nr:hypothetical protein [Gemmatimonadota bacterium]